ncbi:4Fe-4S binding protein [uncultured Pseudodesulfovibrio sp.]|uniref:4Fe-4S binding protein n=1 Tax=uncultured Pseudodesulfovibrio sp. TaxID=2035858 RepID=UPI0029C75867|nr:4Fe-4S binding protein [uncultured Pseudodesulfovibrio sp.]
MLDAGRHPNIHLLAYSQVEEIEGEASDFRVKIRKKARYVDENKCTGCGTCAEKCPTSVPDAYNEDLAQRRAIYKYFAQGIPSVFTIDTEHCRQFQGKKCGVCAKVCQAKAVDFEQQDRIIELNVGAVIAATGYDLFDAGRIPEYGYGKFPNVMASIEFERLLSASGPTAGHVARPSRLQAEKACVSLDKQIVKSSKSLASFEKKHDMSSENFCDRLAAGELETQDDFVRWSEVYEEYRDLVIARDVLKDKLEHAHHANKLAFIQCVGSRDFRFNAYCSGWCCMHSIKEAIIANEHNPETESYIFGMDIRAVGKGFEEYKIRGGKNSGITYIRGRVAEITEAEDHQPVVWYEDTRERKVKNLPVDLVILATACEPSKGTKELAGILGVELDEYGFIKTDSTRPVDSSVPGIFTCGCAQSPIDIPESVAQASSAAARAAETVLSRKAAA